MIGRQKWGGDKAGFLRYDWLNSLRGREKRRLGRGFVEVERKPTAKVVEQSVKRKEQRLRYRRLSAGERCRKFL